MGAQSLSKYFAASGEQQSNGGGANRRRRHRPYVVLLQQQQDTTRTTTTTTPMTWSRLWFIQIQQSKQVLTQLLRLLQFEIAPPSLDW